MSSNYWVVNLLTKEYYPCIDEGSFFDGDWKKRTPWPDEKYENLSVQKILIRQVFQDRVFYNYDLCSSGMIVGIYYDISAISAKDVSAHGLMLQKQQDVAMLSYYPLTLRGIQNERQRNLARLQQLQRSINIISDSAIGFFNDWDLPHALKNEIYAYQLAHSRLNAFLKAHDIDSL